MNFGEFVRLDPYVAHILGLCCADSSECEDPLAAIPQASAKDLLGQGGETFSVLQTGKAGGSAPYRMATCLPLNMKQRQVAYACHARNDVAEGSEDEVGLSRCGAFNFAHPACLMVASAVGETVRLTIGDWAADLPATTWVEDACRALAEQSRKEDDHIVNAGESIVDFEILLPKAQVAFVQPGIISATSLRNSILPLPGYAGPTLIDVLSESPFYVSEALIGAKLVGTVKHGGAPELLIPRSDGLRVVPLEGSSDLSNHTPLLTRELGAWVNEATDHPESWSLLSVRLQPSEELLDLMEPPQWPPAPPRAVLAAKCHFCLGPLHPCPANGDIHALIDFANGVLTDLGKALSINSRLLSFASAEPCGSGSLVEIAIIADEEDVQGQIDLVFANEEGLANGVVEESMAPLKTFFTFAHKVRKGDFADKEEFPYLKDIDKKFIPRLTQRLVYSDLEEIMSIWEDCSGLTNNWDYRVLQPLQQHYSQKELYTYFEKRRIAEKALEVAMNDPNKIESNLEQCIAQAREAEVEEKKIQNAEERLEQWKRLRILLAAQAELDAAEATKDATRLAAAIEMARKQGVDDNRIAKAERELARILAAERLSKAMEGATVSDVAELRAAIEAAKAAGVDTDLIRRSIALLKKLEAEEVLKKRRAQCSSRLLEDIDDVAVFLDSLITWIDSAATEILNGNAVPETPVEEWFRADGISMLQASIEEAKAAKVESEIIEKGQAIAKSWGCTWQLVPPLQSGPAKRQSLDRAVREAKPLLIGNVAGEAMVAKCEGLVEHWEEEEKMKVRQEFLAAVDAADVESSQRILESWSEDERAAMINSRDSEGRTPFLKAAEYGSRAMLEQFHSFGADVEAENPQSKNALDICVTQLLAGAAPVVFSKGSRSSTGGTDADEDTTGGGAALAGTPEAATGQGSKALSSVKPGQAFEESIEFLKDLRNANPPVKLRCKDHIFDRKRATWCTRPKEVYWLLDVKEKLSKRFGSCMGAYRVMDANHSSEVSYTEMQTVLREMGYPDKSDEDVPTIKGLFKLLDAGLGNNTANRDFCLTPKEFEELELLDEDLERGDWQEKLLVLDEKLLAYGH